MRRPVSKSQGTSQLAQCRSSSHMSCCDIGVPRDCIQRYMLRDARWFEPSQAGPMDLLTGSGIMVLGSSRPL